ncbi:hypothetical protein D9758_016214 [Tetrapyrgos nigripes]|uniref:HAT C-terminal dimerisation domain-containing protein n=1 Tax=Tetrapyrgos nigripes TaxID=182062 RepID=A0A8H5CMW0_9AGAR|nr:hypothetical protein D9758_016214 [Tetrapyrgos nigripes]
MLSDMDNSQCAVNPDGTLKDASEIQFYNDKQPPQDSEKCDPIQWWQGQKATFPTLYRLALDIFSIPGSAVAVERVFSGGQYTISLRRASLHPDTIRMLMIAKNRLHLARCRRK